MSWNPLVIAMMLTALAGSAAAAEDPRPGGTPLDVVNVEGCPILILERKSRVVDARALNARGDREGSGMYARKNWGAIERQIVFDLAFRNDSGEPVLAAEFVWEAYDQAGALIDHRTQAYTGSGVGVGEVRSVHDLGLPIADSAVRYRLRVRGALLANGAMWTAPADPQAPDGAP